MKRKDPYDRITHQEWDAIEGRLAKIVGRRKAKRIRDDEEKQDDERDKGAP